ncbi:hypothetical protein RJT34_17877 [Clitoria ternatea]|uniref:Uncharacterized protein n=1 Tax=Clitoria ternatea TaxID=43366 RepID=A0AAN9JB97_CLITE
MHFASRVPDLLLLLPNAPPHASMGVYTPMLSSNFMYPSPLGPGSDPPPQIFVSFGRVPFSPSQSLNQWFNPYPHDALILMSLRCKNLTRLKLCRYFDIMATGMADVSDDCNRLKKFQLHHACFV